MRGTVLGVALSVLFLGGCGSGNTSTAPDLTVGEADLRRPADLSVPLDLEPPQDLTPPDDLVTPEDLRVVVPPKTWQVSVGDKGALSYSPAALNIKVGDSVKWTWASGGHTVTSGMNGAADNKFCSPADMNCAKGATSNANATYTHLFKAAGAYPYFCLPHAFAGMTGTITVK
jgi:plastocyanin